MEELKLRRKAEEFSYLLRAHRAGEKQAPRLMVRMFWN